MFRFIVIYTNNIVDMYDVNPDDIDDEIDRLCQDDNVLDFKYKRLNADGTLFIY